MYMHNWYSPCAQCGRIGLKREMQAIHTGRSSMPPKLLCYLCESCYCKWLEELEINEK